MDLINPGKKALFDRLGYKPHLGQIQVHNLVDNSDVTTVVCGRRFGKMLRVDEPVPTPDGWMTMGELEPGMRVFGADGQPVTVTWVSPIEVPETVYLITFDDGHQIEACSDHQWLSYTKKSRKSMRRAKKPYPPQVVTTQEIFETLKYRDESNHAIKISGAVEYAEADLSIDPYTLGVWLGDGTNATTAITSDDEEVIDYIRDVGYLVEKKVYSDRTPRYVIQSEKSGTRSIPGSFNYELNALGLKNNKHIPTQYLQASIEQRFELLRGLMDTDGYIDKRGHSFFNCSHLPLVNDVRRLVESLGIKCHMRSKTAMCNGKDCGLTYELGFTTDKPVFKLQRKLERLRNVAWHNEYRYIHSVEQVSSSPMRCIEVEGELYQVGNYYLTTHNTTASIYEAIYHLLQGEDIHGKVPFIYIVAPTYVDAEYRIFRPIVKMFNSTPALEVFDAKDKVRERMLYLPNGAELWCKSADNPSSLAGDNVSFAVIEEAGFIDDEAIEILRPSFAARKTEKRLNIGTPDRADTFFRKEFDLGISGEMGFSSINLPSDTNPNVSKDYLEKQRKLEGDTKYRKYYLAEFIDLDSNPFSGLLTDEVIDGEEQEPIPGHRYVAGVDLGQRHDYTVVVVVDVTDNPARVVKVERWNGLGYPVTGKKVADILKSYRAYAYVDETGVGIAAINDIRRHYGSLEGVNFSLQSKEIMFDDIYTGLETKSLRLYNNDVLIRELRNLRAIQRSKGVSYEAPSGQNDDTVMALFLAGKGLKRTVTLPRALSGIAGHRVGY